MQASVKTSRLLIKLLVMAILFILSTRPGFAQSVKGSWDTQFALPPGLNGEVHALVSVGNDLYVGGFFTKAGPVPANGVAKWDGTNWSALGEGVDGWVWALAAVGNNLYVGGQFTRAGSINATNIAKWNGTNWEVLGGGVDVSWEPARVQAIYAQGSNIYVGGSFLRAGDVYVENIARWDGVTWHDMDTGVSLPDEYPSSWGWVSGITGDGSNIYAGGVFIRAGSVAATNLAQWNGDSWAAIGNCVGGGYTIYHQGLPLSGRVEALSLHGGQLYVGGQFDRVGELSVTNLARWDSTNWQAAGDIDGIVEALDSSDESLFAAGRFTTVGGVLATNVAVLTNGVWSSLHLELPGDETPYAIEGSASQLYVGGRFNLANGVSAGNVVQRGKSNWIPLGSGTGNSLGYSYTSLATDGTNVYAAGFFWTAGTNRVSGIAKWDGANWTPVGTLFDGYCSYVAVIETNVYVTGWFEIPEAGATNLACWNGSAWVSLGRTTGNARILAVGGKLYVHENIYDPSSNSWSTIPGFLGQYTSHQMAADGTNIYIAAATAGGTRVGRWDGTILDWMPDIPHFLPSALAVSGINIYLAGSASDGNGTYQLHELLYWDGTTWSDIGFPSSATINSMAFARDGLYITGDFERIGDLRVNGIVKLRDGAYWALGEGLSSGQHSGTGQCVLMLRRKLFVAGIFTGAGGNDSGNFAAWNEDPEIRLEKLQFAESSACTLEVLGLSGDAVDIETSTNLSQWTWLDSITLESNCQSFSDDSPPDQTNRFYRARFVK